MRKSGRFNRLERGLPCLILRSDVVEEREGQQTLEFCGTVDLDPFDGFLGRKLHLILQTNAYEEHSRQHFRRFAGPGITSHLAAQLGSNSLSFLENDAVCCGHLPGHQFVYGLRREQSLVGPR